MTRNQKTHTQRSMHEVRLNKMKWYNWANYLVLPPPWLLSARCSFRCWFFGYESQDMTCDSQPKYRFVYIFSTYYWLSIKITISNIRIYFFITNIKLIWAWSNDNVLFEHHELINVNTVCQYLLKDIELHFNKRLLFIMFKSSTLK